MPGEPILTDDLAERVKTLLGEALRLPNVDVQAFALKARDRGVGLVDTGRRRAMVDERVYAGALLRRNHAERRLAAVIAEVRRVARDRDRWRALADRTVVDCLGGTRDKTTGEFDQ